MLFSYVTVDVKDPVVRRKNMGEKKEGKLETKKRRKTLERKKGKKRKTQERERKIERKT